MVFFGQSGIKIYAKSNFWNISSKISILFWYIRYSTFVYSLDQRIFNLNCLFTKGQGIYTRLLFLFVLVLYLVFAYS